MKQNQESATLVYALTPQGKIGELHVSMKPYEQQYLQKFIDRCLKNGDQQALHSDNWIFLYEFPDKDVLANRMPLIGFNDVSALTTRENLAPTHVVPLRDALYCREHGMDLFGPDARHEVLIHAPGYRALGTHFGLYNNMEVNLQREFPTCRAVDIGEGVLVYDLKHPMGKAAYDAFLQHCADHFFDPELRMEKMGLYDLHPFFGREQWEHSASALNFNFNHRNRDFTFEDLTKGSLYSRDMLRQGLLVKEYDMRPLAESYSLFVTGEDVRFHAGTRTFDIAILDQIVREGYPTERLSSEWRFTCAYTTQFKDLSDKIVLCTDPEQMKQLQAQAQQRAQQFLDTDFATRRSLSPETGQNLDRTPMHHLIPDMVQEPKAHGMKI